MEIEISQDCETLNLKSSLSSSLNSSQYTLPDLNSEDFYDLCKTRLKISKRNAALLLKIK